ncbi:MAG TPA: protein kinase [Planktothrix sp.]|jgi:serine/threonine protein kinase
MDRTDNEHLFRTTRQDNHPPLTRVCPSCGAEVSINFSNCPNDGTVLLAAPEMGDAIAEKYEILGEIGRGGIGVVFKARQRFLNKYYAIKTLHTSKLSPDQIARFHKEARALSQLQHPNLVSVVDFGMTEQNQPYMVMDFIEGQPLSALIHSQGSLEPTAAIDIAIQVAKAISYAHEQLVLHRDLKPENIIISDERVRGVPRVFVLDFGMAKLTSEDNADFHLTKTGEIFGSPLYMSPEQAQGKRADERTDVYSLGCVLFEAIAGTQPFTGDSALEIMVQKMQDSPPFLRKTGKGKPIPGALAGIVATALERDATKRFKSMKAFEEALTLWRTRGVGVMRREKGIKILIGTALGLVIVGCIASILTSLISEPPVVPNSKVESASPDRRPVPAELLGVTSLAAERINNELGEGIVLNDLPISDNDLKLLQNKAQLTRLTIQGWGHRPDLSDKQLDYIIRLPLDELTLIGCPRLDDTGAAKIATMQTLDKLVLEDCGIDAGVVQALKPLATGLHKLGLGNANLGDKGGVAVAETFTNLTTLDLRGTRISGATLKSLRACKNLRELDISYTDIHEPDLVALKYLPYLRSLRLRKLGLDSNLSSYLIPLKELRLLEINDNPNIGSEGLMRLTQLPSLREVWAHGCNILGPAAAAFQKRGLKIYAFSDSGRDFHKDLEDGLNRFDSTHR